MNHETTSLLLNDFVDGTLADQEAEAVRHHLASCSDCEHELRQLESLRDAAAALPRYIRPERDLWKGISERIQPKQPNVFSLPPDPFGRQHVQYHESRSPRSSRLSFPLKLVAALVVAIGSFVLVLRSPGRSWEVSILEGKPRLGSEEMPAKGRLDPGEWLETDEQSRAEVTVADIGHVELGPNSRLRLLNTRESEHRLELERGQMHAKVWSPPRIFIVETPSATAVDLGCSYDLAVDSTGAGTLIVLTGEVSLEFKGRESYVPAGSRCETKPGHGPGTPYSGATSQEFRRLLYAFDFENAGDAALESMLLKSTEQDAITLWHLLSRVDDSARGRVFDRLSTLVKPPDGVTREGIMQLDKTMLDEWLDACAAP